MRSRFVLGAVAAVLAVAAAPALHAADQFKVDPVHSSISFQIEHAGISYVHGRFNNVSGEFTIDKADPSKSSCSLTIKAESVDTNQKGRDQHLRGADFFNAKQFPTISFKSTSFKAVKDGFEVTGEMTMHGETKPVTFILKGGKETEFPPKTKRTGYFADFNIKRSDFGMNKMLEAIGDTVYVSVGIEGTQK